MANQDTRKKLITTTKQLLTNGTPLDSLTARQISSEAGTNLAMINYCFKSKDELLKIAVDEIVAEEFDSHSQLDESKTPRDQLWDVLYHVCKAMIKYQDLTKLSIPYLMLNEELNLPLDILPYIKTHFGDKKSETDCRVIAFEIVYILQLVLYRAEDFRKYSGIDINNEQQMRDFLKGQFDLFLGPENTRL